MTPTGLVPGNPFDERLRAAVAPPGWVNPRPAGRYDLVVLGGGPAGLVAAFGAAGLGARVALVERHLLGGDCLNSGCVPSKALLVSARRAQEVREAGGFGIRGTQGAEVDFPAVMDRMRRLRAELAVHDSAERLREAGVDVFLGSGRFLTRDAIGVGDLRLPFRKALIATGARAAVPPIPGLKESSFHTNETLFTLTELPPRLVVIGGGPIGCEMAQAFWRFGSNVTLLDLGTILPKDEPEAVERIRVTFRDQGIQLLERVKPRAIVPGAPMLVQVEAEGAIREYPADALLVSAGRALNLEGLDLEQAGIEREGRGLRLDPRLRTTNPRVYAAGDVAGGFQFTHSADAQARLFLRNAFFFGRGRSEDLVVPWVTYTDPEVAQVGLTAAMARAKGLAVESLRVELAETDRARVEGDSGFVQALLEQGTDKVLGLTMVGRHAGEWAGEGALLMNTGGRLGTLSAVVHPYPTGAEALKRLGDAAQRRRLTPGRKRLLSAWFRFWRGGR